VQEYLSPLVKIEGVAMAHMTDEEAKRLDEKWTKNPPKPGHNGTGYFTQCKKTAHTLTIDNVTANYLLTKAAAVHKTPAEIIGEMVRERIELSVRAVSV
jgi:hypothetical protein